MHLSDLIQRAFVCAFFAMAPMAVSAEPADEVNVVKTLQSMMDAMSHDNMDAFHRVTAQGFYIFDNGKSLTGDEMMAMLKKAHASGAVFVWQITDPNVHVDGNTAWLTYVNQGSISNASGKKDMKWLESAVLERSPSGWRVCFAHSTREP